MKELQWKQNKMAMKFRKCVSYQHNDLNNKYKKTKAATWNQKLGWKTFPPRTHSALNLPVTYMYFTTSMQIGQAIVIVNNRPQYRKGLMKL